MHRSYRCASEYLQRIKLCAPERGRERAKANATASAQRRQRHDRSGGDSQASSNLAQWLANLHSRSCADRALCVYQAPVPCVADRCSRIHDAGPRVDPNNVCKRRYNPALACICRAAGSGLPLTGTVLRGLPRQLRTPLHAQRRSPRATAPAP